MSSRPLTDDDYRVIAAFRAGLRAFLHASEEAAKRAGLTPQQHQALLAIRGFPGPGEPTIGDLAEALQVRHHSAVGLVDRLERAGLARRVPSTIERRRVHLRLTPDGEAVLASLTEAHRAEHRRLVQMIGALASRLPEELP